MENFGYVFRTRKALEWAASAEYELFDEYVDATQFMKGSARVALDINPPFEQYIFIERDEEYIKELESVCQEYPGQQDRIRIIQGDANQELVDWIQSQTWRTTRAVVFLDPYGMQVEWATLEMIARTKAIDLWVLIPLGTGVNRLLPRAGHPPSGFSNRLTRFFGTDSWMDAFYQDSVQTDLFDEPARPQKIATFPKITEYCVNRLRSIFPAVAQQPLELTNTRGCPIFLLCFAAANPKKGDVAVRIANHILKPTQRRRTGR
jgi:three-Cys-motif partner protein